MPKRSIFALPPEERNHAKTQKGQKIINALINLLTVASQEIEQINDADELCVAQFERIKTNTGSVEQAKLFILMDKFEEFIFPWLVKSEINFSTIKNFKISVESIYLGVLEQAKINPQYDIGKNFESGLEKILNMRLEDNHLDGLFNEFRISHN